MIQTRFDSLHFEVICSSKWSAKAVLAMDDFQYMYRATGLMSNGDQRMASLFTELENANHTHVQNELIAADLSLGIVI
jgi:hypothetical protein